jgi:glycosyltransferase involved in cell wall biosynthesis
MGQGPVPTRKPESVAPVLMRVLIVYPTFPEPDTNSGSYRLFEIIQILCAEGSKITFLAQEANDPRYRQQLEQLGVECVADDEEHLSASADHFRRFLQARAFDAAILVHFYMFTAYAGFVRAFLPTCRLILDTVDLHFVRLEREGSLSRDPVLAKQAAETRRTELAAACQADQVWVVTEAERDMLIAALGSEGSPVHVVPNIHRIREPILDFHERNGIIFLGGYGHRPNVDAVQFFIEQVLPSVRSVLPEVRVTIAGSNPPEWFYESARVDPNIKVTGFVPDHRALLGYHRVGIAPLRYGAGMKGKIGEYLACGLPCVTTSIGAEGMALAHESQVLLAEDPAAFAEAIGRLYRDEALWQRCSQAGLRYIREHVAPECVAPLVLEACRSCVHDAVRPKPVRPRRLLLRVLTSPRRLGILTSRIVRAVRHGGIGELRAFVRVWARKV